MISVGVAGLVAAVFLATSAIVSAGGRRTLQAPLPITSLPTVTLPAAVSGAVERAPGAAARFGITGETFANARILTTTSLGPLYYLAPTAGNCLFFDGALACTGEVTAAEPLSLFSTTPSGLLVGGGVVPADAHRVTVSPPSGRQVVLPVDDNGIFQLTEKSGLCAAFGIHITVTG